MASWTPSPSYHRTIVAELRLIRLELAVAAEENRLLQTLGNAPERDGDALGACDAHGAPSEVA